MNLQQLPTLVFISALALTFCASCKPNSEKIQLSPEKVAAEHAAVWQAKNKTGLAALASNDLDKAESDLVEGLREAEACGPDDPRVAVSLNNLASLYESKKMYSQCASYLHRSRELFRKAYGNYNQMVPVTERNEARILTKQGKWAESIPLYEEAIKAMETQKSRDLVDVKKEYAEALKHIGVAKPVATSEPKPVSKASKPANK